MCHTTILNNVYTNLFWLFDKLSHLSSPNLIEYLKLLLRNIYPGIWTQNKLEYYSNLLGFIKFKLPFILSSKQTISSFVFIKILRLVKYSNFSMQIIISEQMK
jgi:hypothetical protein